MASHELFTVESIHANDAEEWTNPHMVLWTSRSHNSGLSGPHGYPTVSPNPSDMIIIFPMKNVLFVGISRQPSHFQTRPWKTSCCSWKFPLIPILIKPHEFLLYLIVNCSILYFPSISHNLPLYPSIDVSSTIHSGAVLCVASTNEAGRPHRSANLWKNCGTRSNVGSSGCSDLGDALTLGVDISP